MDELSSQGFLEVRASYKPDRVRVAVNAPFGEGQRAAKILDRHGPLAADDTEWEDEVKSPSASRSLDCATLAASATPLSDLFGWRVLTTDDYKSPVWPAALSDDPTPLSNKMGWSVLEIVKPGSASKIKNPATPLSDSLGLSVLTKDDYKSPFWPAGLIEDPTPLSSKFGWSLLSKASDGPAPEAPAALSGQPPAPPAVDPAPQAAPAVVAKAAAQEPSAVAAILAESVVEAGAQEAIHEQAIAEPSAHEASHDEAEPSKAGQTKERKRATRAKKK